MSTTNSTDTLDVTIIGGGLHGNLTALLLADDGHRVTILERDAGRPPDNPETAWDDWDRSGVNQFRMLHFFLPRFRQEIDEHLPAVTAAMEAAGALRMNSVYDAPDFIRGEVRPDDARFDALTGRRPVIEAAIQGVVAVRPSIVVRRDVAVVGLDLDTTGGVPHVRGVATSEGAFTGDLTIDCSGRRSQMPQLLVDAGAGEVREEAEDAGFVYYARHFRSPDGSLPPALGGLLQHYDSLSMLTLPADHGTWGVGVIASSRDKSARALRDPEVWTNVVSSFPLIAHWLDGEPITDVQVMAKLPDRRRWFVVDGQPVATGLVAVGDAWACTNPSLGRGASIGLMQAIALRDHIRAADVTDAVDFAVGWQRVTDDVVGPYYEDTLDDDRHRLAEIESQITGATDETDDPTSQFVRTLGSVATADPDLFRAFLDIVGLLERGVDVAGRSGVADRIAELTGAAEPLPGPDRRRLEDLLRSTSPAA